MAFVPFTGQLDSAKEEQTPKFVPFTGNLDEAPKEGAAFAPFTGELDKPKETAPARVYQDVGDTALVSPEELVTPPPAAPKTKSVMEGYVPPATGDVRMELPELNTQQRRLYDAATPEQRKELIKKDPAFKQIDEAYRLRDEQAQTDTAKKSGIYKTAIDPYFFDTRAEHRKDALIKQGLDPELAETTAKRMAYGGIESKRNPFGEITESPPEYEMAEGLKYNPNAKGIEQTAQVLKRAGTKAVVGLGQAGGGMNRFVGDIFGLDNADTIERLDSMERFSQAMGTPTSKPVAIIEGAINSITQQLPALAAGVATGSEGLVLASMFANSFGQNYDDSRRRGLDISGATTRSAANAAFEVIGERFGLKEQLAGIKAAASNVPTKDVIDYFAKALAKEIPGEELTYFGQFAVDKGFGMNPEAGIKAFIEGAVDTMAATVVQSGMMMGGGAAANKIVRSMSKDKPEVVEALPSALELAQSKGFLREKKLAETPEDKKATAQEAAANVEATTAAAPLSEVGAQYKEIVTRFQQQGFAPLDAERFAEEELKEAGYGSDEIEAGRRELSVSVPSREVSDIGSTGAPATTDTGGLAATVGAPSELGDGTKAFVDTLEASRPALTTQYTPEIANTIINRAIEINAEDGGVTPELALQAATAEVTEGLDQGLKTEAAKAEDTRTTPNVEATGLQPKGKKSTGRPKIILTPEQKAEKDAARKAAQKGSIDAGRTVAKAEQVIDTPFNPEDFPDEQTLAAAQEARNAEVVEALTDAIRIANDPKFRRNKATGQRAQALVNRFAPTDRVRQIAEARAKLAQPAKSLTTTTNEHDPDMAAFNDAPSLLGYIKNFGNAFEKILSDRLRPALKGVKVVHVTDPNTDIPSGKARDAFSNALGMFFNKVMYLNANPNESGQNNETALHEGLHAATLDKVERYYTNPASLTKREFVAMIQLEDIRNRAFEHYEKIAAQAEANPRFARENARMISKLFYLADPNGPNVFGDLKEFITYGMTQPEFQEFLMEAPGSFSAKDNKTISLFTQFVTALRKLFNMGPEHMSALQDLIIVTDRLITPAQSEARIGEPALARKAKAAKQSAAKVDKDLQKVQASYDAYTVADSTGAMIRQRGIGKYLPLLNARFDDMGNDFIEKLLYTMQTTDILRWKGDQIPGLVEVDKIQQQMSAMRTTMLNASAKQADKLAAFIRKNGMQVISTTMHLARLKKVNPTEFATLAEAQQKDPVVVHYEKILTDQAYRTKLGIDPTLNQQQQTAYKQKQTARQNDLKVVYDAWAALGKQKDGHEVYKMVRQFYKDNYLAMRTVLNDQLDALPIDAAAKAKLLKSVRLMQEQAKGAPDPDYDGMTLKQMPEEYFPFKRHGDYWLRVTKGPAGREFYTFDTGSERNEFLRIRATQLGKDPNDGTEFSAGDDIRSLREDFSTDSLMLQQMFAAIEEAKADGRFDPSKYKTEADAKAAFDAYREELKDQIYQVYLMTLPERSFRKQFLHSENVTGFSADILRNFKQSAVAYGNQLAKLKYANDIRNQIQRARDSLEGMPPLERARMELFVNAIQDIANDEIDPPPPGQVANRINQVAFLWLLTSGATAATQMASIPIMVMPTLNERYGTLKAGKEFFRFATFFKTVGVTKKLPNGDVEYTAPSIGSSAMVRNNPILERAFQAALDRHVTTLTNTSVLTNRNRTPENAYESLPGVAGRVTFNTMTALFNGAERMSREIAYMMTFQLEYAKTGNFDASVEKAIDTVHELLGRYDNFNRPRILRNTVGKTVGQFKMYAAFVSSWFVRNGYTALTEGMGSKEGRAAMERLVGVLIMGGLFHGLVGQPLYSTICSTIDAILNATDSEEEKRARRARNPLTSESSNLRFRYEILPKYFGHIEITGLDGKKHRLSEILEKGPASVLSDINIGSRTSFDGIWFRDAKPGKTAQETAINYVTENLGPGVSVGLNMTGAIDDFNDGKLLRGAEKLAPAFFKGPLTAYRLGTEGAETRGGAKILKQSEISDLNLVASAIGFQPSQLARIQEKNFAFQKQMVKAETSKSDALRRLNETVFNPEKEPGDIKTAVAKIREHNKRYPMEEYLIDGDTIDRSIESYGEKHGLTYRGQRMSEKLLPYLMPASRVAAPVPQK